ncbi:hypothetical protein BKA58DRAFT_468154 [Alternaria rosae]|uniref:uncharacterized protein n=1 Tax=Alternaria rosae TaxID=1187941 RepID=UPI001E8ED27F|nr:uncharacterized protein BKA58DRAFT_468154 [Alternaria rosae]KAH6872353.1 hypothetical protein BKA58DRAFT_468154 [Alternaria rosae]
MSAKTNGFAQGTVLKVAYSMLGLTSSVVLARIGLNIIRPRRLTASDYFVFVAFAIYVTMCALYIALSPYMQRVYAVSNGETPPYSELKHDSMLMAKMVFIAFCMFWAVLWSIKLSLLLLYRRLLNGISPRWTFVWWCIAGICLGTFVGNYAFYFQSCGTIPGFWTGGCTGEGPHHTQLVSLYYSFSADISTNMMIMALPIWLTWNLQMPRSKKISILCLFATGVVCVLFACLRVTQVAINASKPEAAEQPLDPTWLAIWGMVECFIAVIIGCCPAFAVLVNAFRFNNSYDSRGYRRQTDGNVDRITRSRLELRPFGNNRTSRPGLGQGLTDSHWAGMYSSQEELRAKHDGIMVSTTVTHEQDVIDMLRRP